LDYDNIYIFLFKMCVD